MSAQLYYVEQQIEKNVGFFTGRRNFNRQTAFLFTIIPAALSACATIAIGTNEKWDTAWLPIVAMVATGVASVIGAWQSLFANRRLWHANNVTLASLYSLKWDIEYRKQDSATPMAQAEVDRYFKRLKAIQNDAENSLQKAYTT